MLLLILHSLQIVQILDAVLVLVKSSNAVVMIVCLLRCLLLHFLRDCYHLYFRSCFAVRLPGPLPLISMMVSLSSGLSIFWDAILLLHFIVLHRITLNHYVGRTCGKACHFLYYSVMMWA
jgi:hypothetical protein